MNTVSRVLNGKLKGSYPAVVRKAERVRQIANKHGYRANAAARAMVTRRTRQVGVLVPNTPGNRFTHPLAYETILGINEGLQRAGYVMVMARLDDVRGDLAKQSRVFEEHVLDGMIVLDSMPREVERRLEELIPDVVWCDSNVWRDHGCVRRDELHAGLLAGQAVVDAGYKHICMVTYPAEHRDHFSTQQRFSGVRQAVAAAGLKVEIMTEPRTGHEEERAAAAEKLTPNTAIITNSIYQALALRSAAEERGLIPGRDFGLACCDDMHQLDRLWPGLARATFARYDMGLAAANMMTRSLDHRTPHEMSQLLPCVWHDGQTLQPPTNPSIPTV
ncbi:MAG: hypothetical protein GC164_10210 [Phycisphaera sp.]|nr:hypothetical protein [Phycisphaera sp.]